MLPPGRLLPQGPLRPLPFGSRSSPPQEEPASLLVRPRPAALGVGPLSAQVAVEMSLPASQPQQPRTTKSCPFPKAWALLYRTGCLHSQLDPEPRIPGLLFMHILWVICSWFPLWAGVGQESPQVRFSGGEWRPSGQSIKEGTWLPSVVPVCICF